MTSSNAPAAGGRIESDDRGPPERCSSPPPPQAHLQPATTGASATDDTILNATDTLVDAPAQSSGSTHAHPPGPAPLEIPGDSSAPAAPTGTSINDSNGADAVPGVAGTTQQASQPGNDNPAVQQVPLLPMLDTALGAFDRAKLQYDGNEDYDHPMLSPPTVSPLSTPAVTHVHIDDEKDMDALVLSAPVNAPELGGGKKGLQEAAAIVPNSTNGLAHSQPANVGAASAVMDLDEPQLPEISAYHAQLIRQGLNPASNRRSRPGGAHGTLEHMQSIATTDPEPDNLQRYDTGLSGANGNVDPNVLMMALANASGAQFDHLPNAIAPSEISLHDKASFTQEDDDPTTPSASARTSQNLESFARIEFEDSVFQMTTYAVIIGRDQKAINQARKDEKRMEMYRRRVDDAMRNGLPPPTPIAFDRGKFSKSYVSEEGGMLGPESDGEDNARATRKKRLGSTHASINGEDSNDDRAKSNRQYVSHTPGAAAVDVGTLQPSTAHIPFIGIHSPGPDIAKKTKGISRQHLKIQFNETLGVFQAIALHRNGFFVGDVICKDEHPVTLRSGEKLQIKDVSFRFIINGVEEGKTGGEELDEETSSKRMSIGGKEMSFDFEHSENEKYQDSSEDMSPPAEIVKTPSPPSAPVPSPVVPRIPPPVATPAPAPVALPLTELPLPEAYPREPSPAPASEPDPMHYGLSQEELALSQLQEAVSRASPSDPPPLPMPAPAPEIPVEQQHHHHQQQQQPQIFQQPPLVPMEDMRMIDASTLGLGDEFPPEFLMQIPKRRGPGRPPKDGIMSKRERRLLKKQLQENSRKTLPQEPQGEKIKRPVGRPRKNPLPEDGDKTEKRKYNKRKSIEDGDLGSDAERRAREKKDKKVRPKSPPLQLNREDFTEEQLAKPSKNYGVLIDEALGHGPPEGLTLKQIYKRITQRYPWFYFHAETKGWESSVRHNLIGNEAFKKAETTGLWSRVPGVELDAGKKRKAVSPDRHLGGSHSHLAHMAQHQYYQGGPYMSQAMPYGHNMQTTYAGVGQAQRPGQPSHTAQPHTQHQSLSQPGYPPQASAPAQLPPGYGVPATNRPPAAGVQQSTYSSPYARPPPPPPPTQENLVKAEPGTATPTAGVQPAAAPAASTATLQTTATMPTTAPQQTQIAPATQPQGQTQRVTPQNLSAGPAAAPARPHLTPEMERAIAQFRTNVMADLSKHTNKAGQIIDAAIGRLRGQSTPPTVPGFEEVERTLVNGLQTMISKMQKVEMRSSTPATASPAPAQPQPQKQQITSQDPPQPQRSVQPPFTAVAPSPAAPAPVAARPIQLAQPSANHPVAQQPTVQNAAAPLAPAQVQQPNVGQPQGAHTAIQPQSHASPAVISTQPTTAAKTPAQPPVPPQTQVQGSTQPQPVPHSSGSSQTPGPARPQPAPQVRPSPMQQPAPVRTTPTPTPSQTPTSVAGPPAAAVSACDAEIHRRIKSFRESIIGTLKAKTNQAEAIVDSAIRRAQGLSNPGAFKGWEQADRLMYESVTKIINDVRKRQEQQAANANASTRSSQTPAPAIASQKGPSASPAPGTPAVASPATQAANLARMSQPPASLPASNPTTTPNMMKATAPHVPRPGVSVARPASTHVQRPSATIPTGPVRKDSVPGVNTANPSAEYQSSQTPSTAPATTAVVKQPSPTQKPAMPLSQSSTPAIKQSFQNLSTNSSPAIKANAVRQNFATAANPSAGVMDQIAAHKPRLNASSVVGQPANHATAAPAATAPTGSTQVAGRPPATTPNFSAAARPSAGVVSQITGHQQRNVPDPGTSKFPSPAPPSAGVLDQISSQHLKMAHQQAVKSGTPGATRPAQPAPSPASTQPAMPPVAASKSSNPSRPALQTAPKAAPQQGDVQAGGPHPVSAPAYAARAATLETIPSQGTAAQATPPRAVVSQAAPPPLTANQSHTAGPSNVQTPTGQMPVVQPSASPTSQPSIAPQPVARTQSANSMTAQTPGVAAQVRSAQAPSIKTSSAPSPAPAPTSAGPATTDRPSVTPAPVSQSPTTKAAVVNTDTARSQVTTQLAGQKRPLDQDTKVPEEPQLKKVAVSAE